MSDTPTLEAELHRQLVLKGFSKTVQGHVMGCFRDAQKIVDAAKPQPPMLRLVAVTPNYTNDLAVMVRRLIVSARKHTPEDSPHRAVADVAWAYLIDKQLIGSPLRAEPEEQDNADATPT